MALDPQNLTQEQKSRLSAFHGSSLGAAAPTRPRGSKPVNTDGVIKGIVVRTTTTKKTFKVQFKVLEMTGTFVSVDPDGTGWIITTANMTKKVAYGSSLDATMFIASSTGASVSTPFVMRDMAFSVSVRTTDSVSSTDGKTYINFNFYPEMPPQHLSVWRMAASMHEWWPADRLMPPFPAPMLPDGAEYVFPITPAHCDPAIFSVGGQRFAFKAIVAKIEMPVNGPWYVLVEVTVQEQQPGVSLADCTNAVRKIFYATEVYRNVWFAITGFNSTDNKLYSGYHRGIPFKVPETRWLALGKALLPNLYGLLSIRRIDPAEGVVMPPMSATHKAWKDEVTAALAPSPPEFYAFPQAVTVGTYEGKNKKTGRPEMKPNTESPAAFAWDFWKALSFLPQIDKELVRQLCALNRALIERAATRCDFDMLGFLQFTIAPPADDVLPIPAFVFDDEWTIHATLGPKAIRDIIDRGEADTMLADLPIFVVKLSHAEARAEQLAADNELAAAAAAAADAFAAAAAPAAAATEVAGRKRSASPIGDSESVELKRQKHE